MRSHLKKSNPDEQLKTVTDKFDAIFYGSETPLVIYYGPDMIYEAFNDKYKALYPNHDLMGRPFTEAVPELKDTQFPIILKRVYETGEHYVSHEGLARIYNSKSNLFEDRYFDTTFSRISYGEGEPYRIMATPREVTDRVMARRKTEAALLELEQERDLREKFIAALSHDLRTPLSVAKISTMILKRKPEDTELVKEMSERIVDNINRVDRMIRDMLDANRIKAGQPLPITTHECILNTVAEYVVKDLKDLYEAEIEIESTSNEITGYWDVTAIHRLLENLITNAVKYRTPGTVVTVKLESLKDFVEITVHNLGEVIPLEEQKTLFNLYHRADSAKKSEQKGWGVGLTLVKSLTEAHGGEVIVNSNEEEGTNFIIRLPYKIQQA